MTKPSLRIWTFVHKWTSLVCTLFLLMLCLTGLPLIFHDEIEAIGADNEMSAVQSVPADTELLDYDGVIARALAEREGDIPLYLSFDHDRPFANVTTAPTAGAAESEMSFFPISRVDGSVIAPEPAEALGVMEFLLRLHVDMFLGLPGMLFLGAMGLLFIAALVSGTVLYAPFAARLRFGEVRHHRSARTRWTDIHNLLGIVILAWAFVVGLTGVINTLVDPITDTWQELELADGGVRGDAPAPVTTSVDAALAAAQREVPEKRLQFAAFPGTAFSSDRHLAVFLQGRTALTERLLTVVLIDPQSGVVVRNAEMPWYMQVLLLSQPLHFGDYAGLPLKILWAILNIATIVILISGLYLWLAKRRRSAQAEPDMMSVA